ncbi:MAG: imidazole glycerol phosphate synthase subunit HisF [candidate division KSB1 bacterium]|nr:imidazole glycerol phosphate synthase subunit HisF [candidate division KSB1 bacterium]MDZ7393277.1 imidazole glycerol phosphate synthase subunit HisF [candidate division KSB1 bacterium]MDZ7414086.1 imidazole glycerol phosphate synthase subunit HisF [candidate division KSB1 bacterium]
MLTTRIIPCLDVEDGHVVKGVRFRDVRRAGDPVQLAMAYNEQGADEIVFLDIGASYRSRRTLLDVVARVADRVFVPLTVGGGIRTVEDMRDALLAGADKVAICTAALEEPNLITEGAMRFGSQCIVLSIDAKRVGNGWHAFVKGGREDTGIDVVRWAKEAEERGAGEILLNSIDRDGTRAGYDVELIRRVADTVAVPVIASGGAGTLQQLYEAIVDGHADAVLLASLLHYREYTVADIKKYLKAKGVPIR